LAKSLEWVKPADGSWRGERCRGVRGRIVTIGSVAAFKGRTNGSIYAVAKAGMTHYTRCLADLEAGLPEVLLLATGQFARSRMPMVATPPYCSGENFTGTMILDS